MRSGEKKQRRLLRSYPWLAGTEYTPATRFVSEDLSGGRFEADAAEPVWFEEVQVRGVDFTKLRFGTKDGEGGLTVNACLFEECDFSNAVFRVAQLGRRGPIVYRRCCFDGTSLRQVLGKSPLMMAFSLGEARFEECTFLDAKIRGWLAHEAEFVGCRFRGTIDRCRFFGTAPERRWFRTRRNEYRRNDFREVDFIWSRFEGGIPIDEQLWPAGPDYVRLDRVLDRIARAEDAVAAWPDEERHEARIMLDMLREDAEDGQDEIFQRRVEPDEPPERAAINERVWALLERPLS